MANRNIMYNFSGYHQNNKSQNYIRLLILKQFGSLEHAIKKFGDKEIQWSRLGMLRLSPEAMRRLFIPTMEKIKQAIGDVLNNRGTRGRISLQILFCQTRFLKVVKQSPLTQTDTCLSLQIYSTCSWSEVSLNRRFCNKKSGGNLDHF